MAAVDATVDEHGRSGSVTSAIPPSPLTGEQLEPLADQDAIDAVWIPDGLPERVYTLAGAHRGRILDFWVETDEAFISFTYGPVDGLGLAWRRHDPCPKGEDLTEQLVEDVLADDYEPLVDALGGGDR